MLTTSEKGEALVLKHYGVKGMKWGVRKDTGGSTRKAGQSSDSAKAQAALEKSKKHGAQSLSSEEMRTLVNRMNLEQQHAQMMKNHRSLKQKGMDFAKDLVFETGRDVVKTQTKRAANYYVAEALDEYLGIPVGKRSKEAPSGKGSRKKAKNTVDEEFWEDFYK